MVNPLRVSKVPYSGSLAGGLYVVGDSQVRKRSLPHLPTLGAGQHSPGVINVPVNSEASGSINCPDLFDHFAHGDVVWADERHNLLRSILSKHANSNTLLVTEQCDNRCTFCSQPPNDYPDAELYHKATLALLNYESESFVGISGGEPTLNRGAFLSMLRILKGAGNKTPLHILTNGRSFSDSLFIEQLSEFIQSRDIVWGIPLYGHTSAIHDSLVRAEGAFLETVSGLMNLGAAGQAIELRIIPVQENLPHLMRLIDFIAHSLPFISVISVMNLEPKGWARNNFRDLVVSVERQASILQNMVKSAEIRGLAIRLFNYPLCLIPEDIRKHAFQSISDWKNYFPSACDTCQLKSSCCGFFTSSVGNFIETVEPMKWVS